MASNVDGDLGNPCKECRSVFSHEQEPVDGMLYLHHPDRSRLDAAATLGCSMCLALLTEIRASPSTSLDVSGTFSLSKWSITTDLGDDNVGCLEVTLYYLSYANEPVGYETAGKRPVPISVSKVHFWLQPTLEVQYPPVPLAAGSTASAESLSTAVAWLNLCKQQHTRCRPSHESRDFYPTRLVDLGVDDHNSELIRIFETKQERLKGHYMTLSHRWGKKTFPMFTEANRAHMMAGFSTASLPQTFQDAIHIVRCFGIRYVWIDCLCILQESASDFECEASLMHQVYGHSYLNICATGAQNNQEPLFFTRSGSLSNVSVQFSWHAPPPAKFILFNAELWKHSVFSKPVSNRGWVMQERFLAPRVLHFGSQQLLWECRELHACEQYPTGLPSAITYGAYDLKTIDLAREADLDISPEIRIYKLWNVLLSTYSRCGLTEPSDKFVALAGIATRVHAVLKARYIAGLWEPYLMYDLLWQIGDVRVGISRPVHYRAPSWSWASSDGPLILGGQLPVNSSARLACFVLDASVELASANPFGPIHSASLLVHAQLKELSIDSPLLSTPIDWHIRARTGLNCGIKVNGQWILSMIVAFDDAPASPPTDDMWCFCVREEEQEEEVWHSGGDGDDESIFESVIFRFGLIIAPTDRSTGEYKRLAYFTLSGPEPLKIWEDAIADGEGQWPCVDYDGSNRLHTFTLV